jgi:uncharacterized protein (DUF1697 family)
MTAWVLLFRGVGGATQLPTRPLREGLAAAGFGNVATYINSGNAVLTSPLPREEVLARVAALCARDLGFTKDIHIRSAEEWEALVAQNPFLEAEAAPKTLHAAALAAEPEPARVATLQALGGSDRLAVRGRVAYLHTPDGFGRSVLAEHFDKGIGVANTARNWTTVLALRGLLRAARDAEEA